MRVACASLSACVFVNSLNSSPRLLTAPPKVASLEPRSFPFIEKIDRVIQGVQVANLLQLFLGEVVSMLLYEMPSYLLCPCPLDATDNALG
jgi:hypothetical protein